MATKFSVATSFEAVDRMTRPLHKMQKSVDMFTKTTVAGMDRIDRAATLVNRNLSVVGQGLAGLAGIAGISIATSSMVHLNREVMRAERQVMAFGQDAIEQMTPMIASAMALSDVFGTDVNEALNATNSLMKQMKLSFADAGTFLKTAFALGLDANNELLDSIREYSPNLADAGVKASDLMGILATSIKDGIFSDKGIDAVNEAKSRITDMSASTAKAIDALGLNSRKMQDRIAEGSLTAFGAIKQIAQAMEALPPTALAVGQAIPGIFGAPGEVAGRDFLISLANVEDALKSLSPEIQEKVKEYLTLIEETEKAKAGMIELASSMTPMINQVKILGAQIGVDLLATFKPLITWLAQWAAKNEKIVRVLASVAAWVAVVAVAIKALAVIVSATTKVVGFFSRALGFFKVAVASTSRWLAFSRNTFLSYAFAMKIAVAAQWAMNAAVAAFPVIAIIALVLAFIAVIVKMIQKWDEWGAALSLALGPLGLIISLIQSFRRHWDRITAAFERGGILAGLKSIKLAFFDALLQPVQQLIQLINKIPGIEIPTDFVDVSRKVIDKELNRLAGVQKAVEAPANQVAEQQTAIQRRVITDPVEEAPTETVVSPGGAIASQVAGMKDIFHDMSVKMGRLEIMIRDPGGVVTGTNTSDLNASVDIQVERGFQY